MFSDFKAAAIVIVGILLSSSVCRANAGESPSLPDSLDTDSPAVRTDGIFRRYWNSLIHGNVDRTYEKAVDMSFLIIPSYSQEAGIGVGGAATGLYRLDKADSLMQPSDFSAGGSITVNGFYSLALKGNTNFPGNRHRLSYKASFLRRNLDFWGIDYAGCSSNDISRYTREQWKIDVDYIYKILPEIHIGASLSANYTEASRIADPGYLQGQSPAYYMTGAGLSVQYDTRDLIVNPRKGYYFLVKGMLYPKFLSDAERSAYSVTIVFDTYQPVWKGGLLAFDLYGKFNSKDIPWTLREELGSDKSRMRGYYGGRYIDCCYASAQIELRQHILGRLGCVAWGGAGTVFPSLKYFSARNILPNFGLGIRFEFKHRMNIRLDYGFGKDASGLVVQFTEAF